MSFYSASRIAKDCSHQTKPQQRSELKQQIENFLKSAATQSNKLHLCSRCGAEMKYIDTTFSLLGTASAWNIKVPFCSCTGRDTASNSSSDCEQTDHTEFDVTQKKASAA